MSYHDLSDDASTPEERRAERDRILKMLEGHEDEFTPHEADFLENVADFETLSPKQMFWLRDIKDKYC